VKQDGQRDKRNPFLKGKRGNNGGAKNAELKARRHVSARKENEGRSTKEKINPKQGGAWTKG